MKLHRLFTELHPSGSSSHYHIIAETDLGQLRYWIAYTLPADANFALDRLASYSEEALLRAIADKRLFPAGLPWRAEPWHSDFIPSLKLTPAVPAAGTSSSGAPA